MNKWTYLGTQFGAVAHYLRLSIWPDPLVLDYGTPVAHGVMEIAPYAVAVGLLALAALAALWRWPKAGFLGAWFFAILGPTSSIVPVVTQTIAEHRMYLPLAAVVAGVVVGGYAAGQWAVGHGACSRRASRLVGSSLVAFVAIAFIGLTLRRNFDYRSTLSMWEDVVAKVPYNDRRITIWPRR